ncbi:MAG: leucine-rich repeat protein [Lachnospiraceae bacterium]|nr:leucine-rich repeat protein [Lachnospiraceae bacterium]
MKFKKLLCGILAAALIVGNLQADLLVYAAEEKVESQEVNAASKSDFVFDKANAAITEYKGNSDVVEIPSIIDGTAVKTIADVAFAGNDGITEVVIPEGITAIGKEAFLRCRNLKKVTIADSVTDLGELAFFRCESLRSINLGKGITTIKENTFYGCTSLKTLEVPESVTEIEAHGFYDCSALEEISIPESVRTFGEEVFTGAENVKICCKKDSPAHIYAESINLAYEIVRDVIVPSKAPTATAAPTKVPTTAPTTVPQYGSYKITYNLKGGKLVGTAVTEYDGSITIRLPQAQRKGYTFGGWYTESSYKNKITVLRKGTKGNVTLYAKWNKVTKPAKPVISTVKNSKSKTMKVTLKKKVSGAKGYELVYATNKKFTKNKKTVRFTSASKTVKGLKKGKTYYVKVRAYKLDSTGGRVYGSYCSKIKTVKITK